MFFDDLAKFVFFSFALIRISSAGSWRPEVEDDVTNWDFDEDSFYSNDPDIYQKHEMRDLVEEDETRFVGKRRILVRQAGQLPSQGNTSTNQANTGQGNTPITQQQPNNPSQPYNASNYTLPVNGSENAPYVVGTPDNPNSDKVNCSDLITGRSNDCWAQLSLSQYVRDWVATHECYRGEGFATCYLRQNQLMGLDCSGISINSCPPPQSAELALDPQKFYVAYNIHSINSFFLSWWLAVGNSGGIAADNIGKIIQIIDPPSHMSVQVQKVLVAFQSIFALAPGIAGVWAAKTDKSYSYQIAAQSVSNALATAPNIGRYLFPTDTSESQVIQVADLGANFAQILLQVQNNLNQTLSQVMANYTEFLAFAEQGNFSSKPQPLAEQSNYLYYAFNTYLISQAMNGNNIYAVIGRGTDPVALATNGTQLAYDIDCKNGLNEQKVCDAWWWSGNYNSSFTLDNFSHMDRNYGDEMTSLFTNMTTGELLFEGAYACNSQGNFGGPVNITVTTSGVNTACISQLKVLTWDMLCHQEDEGGKSGPAPECEFLEIPRQPTFWYNNMHFMSSQPQFSVPAGYLGPAVARKGKIPLKRT